MSKTITVSAIIYNGKYDARNTSYFEELTTLPFKEWLKKHNEERQEEQGGSMKKYRVTQIYTAEDIWYEVEAESKEEAILKIGELPVDEQNSEDTETEVEEI